MNSIHFLFHHFPFHPLPFAMRRVLTVACGLVLPSCCQGHTQTRVAVIASNAAGVATFRKAGGSTINVPKEKLSDADQKYIPNRGK